MGVTGATNLVAVIGGAKPSREPITMPVTLIVRGSTAQRRRARLSLADGATRLIG
jgi:LacI family transcriptional regulator